MTGLLWMILANAGILLGSRKLLDRFGSGHAATDVALFLLFRLLLISLAVLATGALGLFRPWVLGVGGALAAAALAAAGVHRSFLPLWKIPNDPAVWLLGALAARLGIHAWIAYPFLGDVLSYHLPKVAEWVIRGTIFVDLGPDPRSWFPAGMELLDAWWVVFLRHDVLIEMAGIEVLALGAASTCALASRLGLPASTALLAASLFGTVPAIMVQSVFAANDAAVASMVITVAALAVGRVHPALILAAAGLGIGIKATFAFATPGLLLLWFWARRSGPAPAPGRAVWAVAAAGLLLGGVWYARNAVVHGNPLYPAGSAALVIGNQTLLQRLQPSSSRLTKNLGDLDAHLLDRRGAVGGQLQNIVGWGAVAVAFGLVGLLAAVRASAEWRLVAAGFALSCLSVLALAEHDKWVFRFILFVPALLAVAAARLVDEVPLLRIPVVMLTILTLGATFFTEDFSIDAVTASARNDWRHRTAAPELSVPDVPYPRVGCFGGIASQSYLLYRPDFSRDVVYLRPTSPENLIETMERNNLPALYFRLPYDRRGGRELLDRAVRSGRLRRLEESPWYLLVPKSPV